MLVLISYDVNTQDAAGRRRLRLIAKQCVNYGQRVQNSVFECILDAAQCRQLQHKLCSLMDKEKDSLRFYYLGNRYEAKVEHFGINAGYQQEGGPDGISVRTGSEQRFFGRFAPKFVHVWQKNGRIKAGKPLNTARVNALFVQYAMFCTVFLCKIAVPPRKGRVD